MSERKEMEVVRHEPQAGAMQRSTESPFAGVNLDLLFQKAVDSKSAVEVLKELRAMRQEDIAAEAKAQYFSAMKDFQRECPPIQKDTGVPDRSGRVAYRYAKMETVAAHIAPYCDKYGFSYSFDQDFDCPPGNIGAIITVNHIGGHSEQKHARYRWTTKTGIMSDTQQDAATYSFVCRRALQSAFGLVISGEDQDGAGAKPKPKGPSSIAPTEQSARELAKELWSVMSAVRGPEKNWNTANQYCWNENLISDTESLPDLTPARFREVIAKAKQKLSQP